MGSFIKPGKNSELQFPERRKVPRNSEEEHSAYSRTELILEHMPLVESIVKRFFHNSQAESKEDLVQVGAIGLMKAVDRYDPAREVLFTTYATHQIFGEIRHYLRDKSNFIRPPRWLRYLNRKVFSETALLTQELGRFPSPKEIADRLNIQEEGVSELLRFNQLFTRVSLDEDWKKEWEGIQGKIRSLRLESFQLPIEDQLVLSEAIHKLMEVEQKVVYLFFYYDLTQSEIGKRLGLSQRSVSRVIGKAVGKLHNILTKEIW